MQVDVIRTLCINKTPYACWLVIVLVAAAPSPSASLSAARAAAPPALLRAQRLRQPPAVDYSGPGPCGVDDAHDAASVALPPESGCHGDCALSLRVTAPRASAAAAAAPGGGNGSACERPPAGWPVLLFYPGFELRAAFYDAYAARLASWGWAVVRYDLPLLRPVPALAQAGYAPYIVARLAELSAGRGGRGGRGGGGVGGSSTDGSSAPGGGESRAAAVTAEAATGAAMAEPGPAARWRGAFDVSTLAAAGHSRGGKVAALHLAGQGGGGGGAGAPAPRFAAGYLIDPVDSDFGASDPPAAPLLRAANRAFGLAAAGVRGPCNPEARTRGFWDAAAPGSWREALLRAGHADLADVAPTFERRVLDLLCGRGADARGAAVGLALPPMVAWLDAAAKGGGGDDGGGSGEGGVSRPSRRLRRRRLSWRRRSAGAQPPDAFWDWVASQQLAGEIRFDIKQGWV